MSPNENHHNDVARMNCDRVVSAVANKQDSYYESDLIWLKRSTAKCPKQSRCQEGQWKVTLQLECHLQVPLKPHSLAAILSKHPGVVLSEL